MDSNKISSPKPFSIKHTTIIQVFLNKEKIIKDKNIHSFAVSTS